ncbi:MAG: hypothetical protein D6706_22160 [Chloroflexi bacterium]|nr:MAG: hypothetical protein D6706_22160 [Chloroflexota bacterium]
MHTKWQFHHLIIEGWTNNANLWQSWQTSFASLPVAKETAVPDLRLHLELVKEIPPPPAQEPDFRQGDLLAYYVRNNEVIAHAPRFGQLKLSLSAGTTHGWLKTAVFHTYGVLEDLLAISLSPHLRRRNLFLIHAFAAAYQNQAILLIGGIGAGKTTTGISLLHAGWRLLANDSPILAPNGIIRRYPGQLAAYPETFARFPETHHLAKTTSKRQKLVVSAETIWPNVWQDAAPVAAICFPQIEKNRVEHVLEPVSPPQALAMLLPHTMEQWDRAMMPTHLAALRQLVEYAPAYHLRLGPDVLAIPQLLSRLVT